MVDDNFSLGEAIQKLKPSLSSKQVERETKRAEGAKDILGTFGVGDFKE
jgi:hypothetical protein